MLIMKVLRPNCMHFNFAHFVFGQNPQIFFETPSFSKQQTYEVKAIIFFGRCMCAEAAIVERPRRKTKLTW